MSGKGKWVPSDPSLAAWLFVESDMPAPLYVTTPNKGTGGGSVGAGGDGGAGCGRGTAMALVCLRINVNIKPLPLSSWRDQNRVGNPSKNFFQSKKTFRKNQKNFFSQSKKKSQSKKTFSTSLQASLGASGDFVPIKKNFQ